MLLEVAEETDYSNWIQTSAVEYSNVVFGVNLSMKHAHAYFHISMSPSCILEIFYFQSV